ncbi:MAG TPA: hypothetical protein VGQ44_21945 [Gemmatimonadaceae bacterium]|jgi:hypothetical protein|nr:hypothetical protein [Gemmatimonadaceae bacterium]
MVDRVPTQAAPAAVSGGDIANDGNAITLEPHPEEVRELATAISIGLSGNEKPIAGRSQSPIADDPRSVRVAMFGPTPAVGVGLNCDYGIGAGGKEDRFDAIETLRIEVEAERM